MFQGLSTALTALYADRQNLETTGNNIANVNTPGYARERVDQQSINGSTQSFWNNGTAQVGEGVNVTGISRITDQFLQAQSLSANGSLGTANANNSALQKVQGFFQEPTSDGLQNELSTFWQSWDAVGNDPGNLSARTQLIEQSQTLTTSIQQISQNLQNAGTEALSTLTDDVSNINSMAQSIAKLNTAIIAQTNSGNAPNGLMDQRDALVDKISTLIGVSVKKTPDNGMQVLVNGVPLVNDSFETNLKVDNTGSPVQLRWDVKNTGPSNPTDGNPATITDGDVAGQLNAINNVVPKYTTLMNNVTTALMTTVNTQHQAGQDENGNPGLAYFTGTDSSNIAVNPLITADPTKVAAAQTGGGALDGENARAMANLANVAGGPDSTYQSMIDVLGVDAQAATTQATITQNIANAASANVQSVQGVNLDEEMTNMIQYQTAYQAAAKYLNVLNTTMDSLMQIVG